MVNVVEGNQKMFHGTKNLFDEILLVINFLTLRIETNPELFVLLLVNIQVHVDDFECFLHSCYLI